jgi:hypothetical protein
MAGLTLVVKSTVIDNNVTTDTAIAAVLNAVSTTHIYSVTIVPISNTTSRLILVYD